MRSGIGNSPQDPFFVSSGGGGPATSSNSQSVTPSSDGFAVQQGPTTASAASLTPVTATNASSLQVKAAAGNFYGGSLTAGATAGFLIAYNSATVPASGAALTAALILGVTAAPANATVGLGDYAIPDRFSAGIVLLFSTAIATYTIPTNVAGFIRGRAA